MDIKPIKTDADYEAALAEIDRLWGAEYGSPQGEKLDILATLVEAYEEKQYPIPPPDPCGLFSPVKEDVKQGPNLVVSGNKAAIELLRAWREGDESEQQETWDYLKQTLEEERLSNRKLFK